MDYIGGMDKIGSGKINQMTLTEYLAEQVQLITNDVKALSYINSDAHQSSAVLLSILQSRAEAAKMLDDFTVNRLTELRKAAMDLAMMCNNKILGREEK